MDRWWSICSHYILTRSLSEITIVNDFFYTVMKTCNSHRRCVSVVREKQNDYEYHHDVAERIYHYSWRAHFYTIRFFLHVIVRAQLSTFKHIHTYTPFLCSRYNSRRLLEIRRIISFIRVYTWISFLVQVNF